VREGGREAGLGYGTQKRMTGANEGFLEVIGTQANVVEEKLQRADG
jgi:hypothetical protein